MRSKNQFNNKNVISATPRQLESLIRLAQAKARLRFSKYVEKEDVDEAVRLIEVATLQAAVDPKTGLIDMDALGSTVGSISRQNVDDLQVYIKQILRSYSEEARKGVKFQSLLDEIKKKIDTNKTNFLINEDEIIEALRNLEKDGLITLPGHKRNPLIKLISHETF